MRDWRIDGATSVMAQQRLIQMGDGARAMLSLWRKSQVSTNGPIVGMSKDSAGHRAKSAFLPEFAESWWRDEGYRTGRRAGQKLSNSSAEHWCGDRFENFDDIRIFWKKTTPHL